MEEKVKIYCDSLGLDGNPHPIVKSSLYRSDVFTVKQLDENEFKLVLHKRIRVPYVSRETLEQENMRLDFEFNEEIRAIFAGEREKPREMKRLSGERMLESLSRSKRLIWEYARCNEWDYFVTLTIDPEKYDRKNLRAIYCDMSRMLAKLNQSVTGENWGRQRKIEYVIVPELHKDGCVHFHGLMRGFHKSDLRYNEHNKLEWRHWRDNFGFMNMEPVRDRKKVASYVTKYITKDLKNAVTRSGDHVFYASHGLKKAVELYRGYGEYTGEWDYSHPDGYIYIKTLTREQLEKTFFTMGE